MPGSTIGRFERLIGAIDEVRVWTIARTAQQIAADYTVSLTGTEPDLIAYYRFDEGYLRLSIVSTAADKPEHDDGCMAPGYRRECWMRRSRGQPTSGARGARIHIRTQS